MAVDDRGERNRPIYAGVGAPADAEDLTYLGQLITILGTRRAGTSAERLALGNEWLFDGLEWAETDTGLVWRCVSGAWVIGAAMLPRLRMQRPLAGISATQWMAVSMSSSAQEGGSGFVGGAGSFQVPVTARYGVNLKAATPATTAGNRRMLGIATQANVGSPIVQSPGTGAANDSSGFGIDFYTEVTLQAGTAYVVAAYSTAPLNFSNFDVSVRFIQPTTIG